MYKSYTAEDYKTYFGFEPDYKIEGFLVYGSYQTSLYETLKDALKNLGYTLRYRNLPHDFWQIF